MITLADLLSVQTEIKHIYEGVEKTYALGPPNILQQGKFQRWLEQRAREAVDRGAYASEDDRDKAMNAVTRDIATGFYEWEGPASVTAFLQPSGHTKFLEIVLGISEKEAKSLVEAKRGMIVKLVQTARAKNPKALRAVLTTLGLPADFLSTKKPLSSGSARRAKRRKQKSRR